MKEKIALITGGSAGIGKRTAYYLAKQGYQLAINYRQSESEASSLAKHLTDTYGTKNDCFQADIANEKECIRMVEQVLSVFSSIDILIHNAGPYIHQPKKMTEYTFEEWNYLMNGNLASAFFLAKLIIPHMREKKWGRVITFGFDRVETAPGWIYRSAFAAAKTGLASLTRTIALEEAENGITANMVCPGDITKEWKEKNIADAVIFDQQTPVGRPGTGEDVARVIAFLADEQSSFITGSIIPVTGGVDVLSKRMKI
ncbi:SDR family oxidoreductase [Neobacillus sp. SM06]|uniref:SDR family oxidoreductase n=1 Tax=Neobacillus sp. SM06 TaxID=3422492 RepID=UPI003D2E9415